MPRTPWRALLATLPLSCVGGAQAVTFTDSVLAAIASNVGSLVYSVPEAPSLLMTVTETSSATMAGSALFDYEGLWLGSDGTGGRYTFSFNQPVSSISFSFIALSNLGSGLTETLNTFVADVGVSSAFSSIDGSATWSAGTLTPLEEDSRGVLSFSVVNMALNSIRFDHLQPAQLQGLVLERVEVQLAPVPEPAPAWLYAAGLALLLARWRWQQRAATAGVEP